MRKILTIAIILCLCSVVDAQEEYTRFYPLHYGLNTSLGTSVFANSGGGVSGVGFTQDISLTYVTSLSPKTSLYLGGYLDHVTWKGDNYTVAGINALINYRINEHWSAYAFVQKAFNSGNVSNEGWSPYYTRVPYSPYNPYNPTIMNSRFMDRIGGGVRYEWGNHNYIEIQVEADHVPTQRNSFYDYHRYDYPVR